MRRIAGLAGVLPLVVLSGCGSIPTAASHGASPASALKATTTVPSSSPDLAPPTVTQGPAQMAPPTTAANTSETAPSSPPTQATQVISAMTFVSPQTGWVAITAHGASGTAQSESLDETHDGGKHWTTLWTFSPSHPAPWQGPSSGGLAAITTLNFRSPLKGDALVFNGVGACQASFSVIGTTNGGRTWSVTKSTLMGEDGPLSLSFPAGGQGQGFIANGSCAGSYTTLIHTSDGGFAWSHESQIKASSSTPSSESLRFSSTSKGYLVTGINGFSSHKPSLEVSRTTNGGTTWNQTAMPTGILPDYLSRMSFVSPTVGWVAAAKPNHAFHLYTTTNGGAAWAALNTPTFGDNPPRLDLVSAQVGYLTSHPHASASTDLWRTDNGGLTWSQISLP